MSHSRQIDVETTSYVYSVKVKQTIKDHKIFSNIETKHQLKIGNLILVVTIFDKIHKEYLGT